MRASLSRRLGDALGTHIVDPADRDLIFEASQRAEEWDDLPAEVQRLVEDIESRPEWTTEGQ